MELRAAATQLADLYRDLFRSSPAEGAAFLSVEPSEGRLLLHSYRVFGVAELDSSFGELSLKEETQVEALASIKRAGQAVVEVHTHPGSGSAPSFSAFDESQLPGFSRYVGFKIPGRPFGAIVLGEHGYTGRCWTDGRIEELKLMPVGERRALPDWIRATTVPHRVDPRLDRQVRALGPEGQQALSELRVGIVGLGGTGSQVVQQLVHLGIRDFLLVEDERVELSNLSRLAGASWWDPWTRSSKASVAKRLIRRLAPQARITATGSLRAARSLLSLQEVDLIVGCVDNDGARLILSELAAAYLVPYLDIGVGIEGTPTEPSVGGRVSFYLPGGPCLACADEIDFEEAAEDLESETLRSMRIARGYARDRGVEPALMPLNTVLVGIAMMELLAFATGMRTVVPFARYDALSNEVKLINAQVEPDCPVCRPAFAKGERQLIDRYALT